MMTEEQTNLLLPDDDPRVIADLRRRFQQSGPQQFGRRIRSFQYPGKWWSYWIEVDGSNGVRIIGKAAMIDSRNAQLRSDQIPVEVRKRGVHGCSKCKSAEIIRWMGIRWYGVPAPVRWYLKVSMKTSWRNKTGKYLEQGCGCIVKLKALAIALTSAWHLWRTA